MPTVKKIAPSEPFIAPAKFTIELSLQEALYLRYLLHYYERAPDSVSLWNPLQTELANHDVRLCNFPTPPEGDMAFTDYISEYATYLGTNIP